MSRSSPAVSSGVVVAFHCGGLADKASKWARFAYELRRQEPEDNDELPSFAAVNVVSTATVVLAFVDGDVIVQHNRPRGAQGYLTVARGTSGALELARGDTPALWTLARIEGGLGVLCAPSKPFALAGEEPSGEIPRVACLKCGVLQHERCAVAPVVPLQQQLCQCCGGPITFSISIELPPIVDISPLLRAKQHPDEANNEGEQLDAMQSILDAAQDVGYFFITGCDDLERCAATMLSELQRTSQLLLQGTSPEEHGHSLSRNRCTKHTLMSSSGLVKTSSNPVIFAPVVPPAWIAESSAALIPVYYTAAMAVVSVLMESLMQDAAVEEDWYCLLRAVVYPPKSLRKDSDAQAHGNGAEDDYGGRSERLDVHTDKCWMTLLATTSVDGLEYVAVDGDHFVPAVRKRDGDVLPLLLVNIGDAFQMASRGAMLSRSHRAMNCSEERVRVSLPLFVEPGEGKWPLPYTSEEVMIMDL